MRKAIIVDPGREYPNYRIFANKIGYPDAAVDLEGKDERRPLIKGEEVTILAEGIHGLDEISKIYVIEKENGERHLIGMDGLRFLDTNPDVHDLIANLARRVLELERAVKRLGIEKAAEEVDMAVVKKRQPTRDDIVRRAIEDVAELGQKNKPYEIKFVNSPDERIIVALVKYKDRVKARGIAICAPNDVFNAHIGKVIALRRALGLEIPAEYLNAPQPEKVRAGDLVRIYFGCDDSDYFENKIVGFNEKLKLHLLDDGWHSSYNPDDGDRIIDDTESTTEAAANVR